MTRRTAAPTMSGCSTRPAAGTSCAPPTSRASPASRCGGWGARIPASGAASPASPARGRPTFAAIDTLANVDVEGAGEILRIEAVPDPGPPPHRRRRRGLIRAERYDTLPSPYLVRRTGYRPGLVALTFDDGPDPDWTPAILDVLRDRHVPATFFVVGENALGHPGLLSRIVAEGHELGNHSYTHPNFATISGRRGAARAQRHRAAGRGLYRARHAPVPRALFRRRRADHRRRARPGAGRAAGRLSQRRPPRRQRGLAAARRRRDRRQCGPRGDRGQCGALGPDRPAPRRRRRPGRDGGGAAADHRRAAGARLPLRAGLGAGRADRATR